MKPTFAYSVYGEQFSGNYSTREEAQAAGTSAARRQPDAPMSIYVGRRVSGSAQADGHAEQVIAAMRRRARNEAGEPADGYLRNVNEVQEAQLDAAIERAVNEWLSACNLAPRFGKVEGVSEHQVPQGPAAQAQGSQSEVYDIGPGEYFGA